MNVDSGSRFRQQVLAMLASCYKSRTLVRESAEICCSSVVVSGLAYLWGFVRISASGLLVSWWQNPGVGGVFLYMGMIRLTIQRQQTIPFIDAIMDLWNDSLNGSYKPGGFLQGNPGLIPTHSTHRFRRVPTTGERPWIWPRPAAPW